MIYITSDLHFNHDKFFLYIPRGFKSVEEMNKYIVSRWNDTITNEDDVYILGDLMLNDNDSGMELLRSLNGKLHIIYGNHDTPTRQKLYNELENVVEACYATTFKYKHYNFYLSHYPTLCSNYDIDKPLKARVISLCGHTHTEDKFADMDKGLIYHCELDAHNCCPVLLDDIIWDIKNYELHQEEEMIKVIADAFNAIGNPRAEDVVSIEKAISKWPVIEAFCRDCINQSNCPGPSIPEGCPPGKQYEPPRCHKCVYNQSTCGDSDKTGKCKTYKRDPPDGGFYG